PFVRELWGRHFAFAHNGTLRGVKKRPLGRFRPIGSTDSTKLSRCMTRWRRKISLSPMPLLCCAPPPRTSCCACCKKVLPPSVHPSARPYSK
ncbi:MAG: hypothetical protein EBV03_07355, partial [Proteobacteria bacterium]|nr:hypothetical protein [Pseudomonadota bacterium]